MAYRVGLPKNKENFAQEAESLGGVPLPKNTGNTGNTGNRPIEHTVADPTEGRIVAVEICSNILEAHIWLAFDDSFKADDGLAVFYADELPFLASKDAATLREIHKVKLAFGGGRVRQ
jgi:hypothetical protein